jgi:plasmid stabilization system protein ParE
MSNSVLWQMKMRDIRLNGRTKLEYVEALAWYQTKSDTVARRFATSFFRAISLIQAMPEGYPKLDKTHRWCKLKRYPYIVVYRVNEDEILVVGLTHSRQSHADWGMRF